jgi:enoyl-CoA hydratase/carnithine racemase
VIVSPFSVLHFWQRKIGLSYGWGGGRRIAARCGLAPARALLQSARSLTANQALELGLVDRVIAASTQELEAQRYISKWLRTNPQSGSRIKRWSPKQESAVFADLWWAEEHRAALKERAP